jgi:hypothetical protein
MQRAAYRPNSSPPRSACVLTATLTGASNPTEEPEMPHTITVDAEHVPALRNAVYSCLTNSTDVLNSALTRPERESNSIVQTAYLELAVLAHLLDRTGWQHHDQQQPLTIDTTADARLIVEALTIELQIEEDLAFSNQRLGGLSQQASAKAATHAEALHDALAAVGAAAANAGLLSAGSEAPSDHPTER